MVCAWHVLEHLRDPADAVERVAGALAPGGYFVAEVPNIDSLVARRRKLGWRPLDLRHHVGHYNATAMTALLERAGLKVVHTETFPTIAYAKPATAIRPLVAAAQVKEMVTAVHASTARAPHQARAPARRRAGAGLTTGRG